MFIRNYRCWDNLAAELELSKEIIVGYTLCNRPNVQVTKDVLLDALQKQTPNILCSILIVM